MHGLTYKGYMAIIEQKRRDIQRAIQESGPTPFHVRQTPKTRKEVPARNRQQEVA